MDSISIKAYAKINLSLDVVGRRENGYHDIESLMQAVDMCDDMIVASGDIDNTDGYEWIDVVYSETKIRLYMNAAGLKPDENNLAIKGAKRFIEIVANKEDGFVREIPKEVSLLVDKKLPIAAGIAGGSGNAAGAMLGLNAIMGFPLDMRELMDAGYKVGADVPFSIMLNSAMNREVLSEMPGVREASVAADVSGIGEIVEPREPIYRNVIIANPGVAVSTKEVYEAIDAIPEERRARQGLWRNVMEEYTIEAYPKAKALKDALLKLGAEHVLMSGSGPTMVAYYTAEETAIEDYNLLMNGGSLEKGWRIWLTTTGKEPQHDGLPVKGSETTEGTRVSRTEA